MRENEEYHLGYFEGIRNVFMAYAMVGTITDSDFMIWLSSELAEAKQLRDGE